jgi:O-antigen/teichoic acid export membrane protein
LKVLGKLRDIFHERNWKNLVWLFIVQAISLSSSIGIGKIIALYISPDQYGSYILIFGLSNLVIGLFFRPIIQNLSYQFNKHRQAIWLFTLQLLIISSVVAVVSASISVLFNISSFVITILALSATLLQILVSLGSAYYQLRGRHKDYGLVQIISSVIQLIFLWVFWQIFKQGSAADLWGALVFGNSFVLLFILRNHYRQIITLKQKMSFFSGNLISDDLKKSSTLYIKPLIVFAVLGWMTDQLDRWVVVGLLNGHEVGVYSMAVSVGAKINIMAAPFLTFVYPKVFACQMSNLFGPAIKSLKQVSIAFGALALTAVIFLYFWGDLLGNLLLSPVYSESFSLFYIIGIAYSFIGLIYFNEIVFYASGATKYLIFCKLFGVVFGVGACLLLTPHYGIKGTAIALVLGAFSHLLATYYFIYRKYTFTV